MNCTRFSSRVLVVIFSFLIIAPGLRAQTGLSADVQAKIDKAAAQALPVREARSPMP